MFKKVILKKASLVGAEANGADFSGAQLDGVSFNVYPTPQKYEGQDAAGARCCGCCPSWLRCCCSKAVGWEEVAKGAEDLVDVLVEVGDGDDEEDEEGGENEDESLLDLADIGHVLHRARPFLAPVDAFSPWLSLGDSSVIIRSPCVSKQSQAAELCGKSRW